MWKYLKFLFFISLVFCLFSVAVLFSKKDSVAVLFSKKEKTLKAQANDGIVAEQWNRTKIVQETCPKAYLPELSLKLSKLHNLSMSRSVRFKLNSKRIYTDTIVIMTPISNAIRQLPGYFSNLCRLTYPHRLISIALIEDSSKDNTYRKAENNLEVLQKHFAKVSLFSNVENIRYHGPSTRHEMGWQLTRRTHLAKSRNALLSRGLGDETWVLWMDSDVQYIPFDLIEQLLAADRDIVVPSCMFQSGKKIDIYDKNTWKETDTSKTFLKDKGNEFLMLEGYGPPMRSYLNKLKNKGNIVEIDGVGGCVLLIKADLHRKGLVFPPYVYKNHIETEGLAKMAQDMGFKIYGLPNFEVYHE